MLGPPSDEIGVAGDLVEAPGEDVRVRGQRVAGEVDRHRRRLWPRPGHQPRAEADDVGKPRHLGGQLAGRCLHLQVPHRRGEDRAAEVRPLEQRAEPDAAAHGMRDEIARPGQVEPRLEIEERRHVLLVDAEVLDVPEHGVGRVTVGEALAAPVDDEHREAARHQLRAPPARISRRTRCGRERSPPFPAPRPARRPREAHAVRSGQPVCLRRPRGVGDVGIEGRGVGRHARSCRAPSPGPCRRPPSAGRS